MTDDELETIRRRIDHASDDLNNGIGSMTDVSAQVIDTDAPTLLAEVDRLRHENEGLRFMIRDLYKRNKMPPKTGTTDDLNDPRHNPLEE